LVGIEDVYIGIGKESGTLSQPKFMVNVLDKLE